MKNERSKKLVALDIDQTLAGGVVQAHLRSYNRILGLRMSEQEIMQANAMYRKTFDVPQIIEYRVRHEDRFQAARKDILQSQQVNAELLPIDGSADAVTLLLSTYAHLGYYTVRPPEMLEVTKSWLANHRFPNAEETFITKDHADKIRSVNSAGQALESDPVLIDDSFKDLLEVAFFQNILERLKLVGFGLSKAEARTIAASKDVSMASQVFGIPNWQSDSVEDLKGFIR